MKRSPMPPGDPAKALSRRVALSAASSAPPRARKPIRQVSAKRARENRARAAMADRRWPDRRDGTVMCECGRPECNRRADDGHEILTRARGGSITDEANVKALARECHQEIQLGPAWAYRAGLIKHDALCCRGRDVCARYEDGAA